RFSLKNGSSDQDKVSVEGFKGEEADQRKGELKVNAIYAKGLWSGTVQDSKGNALPGAIILLEGTSTGTVTDINGRFSINASQSGNLYALTLRLPPLRDGQKKVPSEESDRTIFFSRLGLFCTLFAPEPRNLLNISVFWGPPVPTFYINKPT